MCVCLCVCARACVRACVCRDTSLQTSSEHRLAAGQLFFSSLLKVVCACVCVCVCVCVEILLYKLVPSIV